MQAANAIPPRFARQRRNVFVIVRICEDVEPMVQEAEA